ncbi:hypothetical protein J4433_03240 [Candidatus Pacearchaeota archaeon]|nr:hypothetical protein [Candidatus Pacearchaeota archaeon]
MTISTLVEKIEQSFEKAEPKSQEPKTLAEAVSNSLIKVIPRISPELFDIRREVDITLSSKQIEKIDTIYKMAHPFGNLPVIKYGTFNDSTFGAVAKRDIEIEGEEEMKERKLKRVRKIINASIPLFSYANIKDKIVCYPKSLDIIYEQDWKEKRELAWPTDGALGGFCRESGEYQDLGKTNLNIKGHWSPNFKLNVAVEVPELPRGFVELGDEAVALYYAHVKGTSKELRKKTSLRSPSLGVLWIPNPKAFYATGNIPKIEPPPKKGDPVLVLDIPGEKRSYRHAVAAWNIGEEIHFRNWLAEYTEGGRV